MSLSQDVLVLIELNQERLAWIPLVALVTTTSSDSRTGFLSHAGGGGNSGSGGYRAPSNGYGAPSTSYGAPSTSYGAPSSGGSSGGPANLRAGRKSKAKLSRLVPPCEIPVASSSEGGGGGRHQTSPLQETIIRSQRGSSGHVGVSGRSLTLHVGPGLVYLAPPTKLAQPGAKKGGGEELGKFAEK